jgi:hypothetical protein
LLAVVRLLVASQEQAEYGPRKASGTEAKCLALFRNVARP